MSPAMGAFELAGRGDGEYALTGELTFATASLALKTTAGLFKNGDATLCFDLADIERSDSAGMALLIEWLRLAERAGTPLRYTHLPENLRAMARVSGVAEFLSTDPANPITD